LGLLFSQYRMLCTRGKSIVGREGNDAPASSLSNDEIQAEALFTFVLLEHLICFVLLIVLKLRK